MPSPFPGMDPWLEAPARWGTFHHDMISEIKNRLTQDLRPKYYARVEERVYISDPADPGRRVIIPDVRILARDQYPESAAFETQATAVAEPIVLTTLIDDEIREAYIEVRDAADRRVVTVVEVVSPTSKVRGSRGRNSYQQKRSEVMNSDTHFVEIDLLRAGEPIAAREPLPPGDYFVHVSPADQRPEGLIWSIKLRQELPTIGIPLLPEDDDASLDLQAVFSTIYDQSAYDLDVDYTADPPPPPLAKADADWAAERLREAGLRA